MGAVVLLAAAWTAFVWSRPPPIRVAFANSLISPSAPAGLKDLVVTKLAIDQVNTKGGIGGRLIELLPFYDASSAPGTVNRTVTPKRPPNADLRTREYLTEAEVERLLARRPDGIFLSDFEQGEIGPDLFRKACEFGLEGLVSKHRDRPYRGGRQKHWIKVKDRKHQAMHRQF
jgi:hypothetical protein